MLSALKVCVNVSAATPPVIVSTPTLPVTVIAAVAPVLIVTFDKSADFASALRFDAR